MSWYGIKEYWRAWGCYFGWHSFRTRSYFEWTNGLPKTWTHTCRHCGTVKYNERLYKTEINHLSKQDKP